ncbi:TetR-like C-terminal domain-containing protein [Ponticaulis sp.]|uniref:TetR-like C-terminal domain-containing protein n=1 Tax=Ponticaulis sp. TaxID=2020902 RepID=UPI0025E5F9B2|nr:TetR-like C-terminal domain-containing protein [Ponticaulis sp.]|tara:strand:- start:38229 stop:38852 length:624 start_codon:yes stop_codon:yes gene_type:complete
MLTAAAETSPVVDFSPRFSEEKVFRGRASRNAVMAAARDEIAHSGWREFDLARVLNKAKATEQCIAEWWATPACLVVEAVLDVVENPTVEDSLPLPEQLSRIVDPMAEMANAGQGAQLLRTAVLAAADDKEAGAIFRNHLNLNFRKPLKQILASAAAKKKVRRDYDVDMVFDILFGPFWNRVVVMRSPFSETSLMRAVTGTLDHLQS